MGTAGPRTRDLSCVQRANLASTARNGAIFALWGQRVPAPDTSRQTVSLLFDCSSEDLSGVAPEVCASRLPVARGFAERGGGRPSPWLRGRLTSSPLRLQFVNAATNMRAEPHFKWPHPGSFMEVTHGSRLAVEGAGLGRIQPFCRRTRPHTPARKWQQVAQLTSRRSPVRAQHRPFWTPKAH